MRSSCSVMNVPLQAELGEVAAENDFYVATCLASASQFSGLSEFDRAVLSVGTDEELSARVQSSR